MVEISNDYAAFGALAMNLKDRSQPYDRLTSERSQELRFQSIQELSLVRIRRRRWTVGIGLEAAGRSAASGEGKCEGTVFASTDSSLICFQVIKYTRSRTPSWDQWRGRSTLQA